MKNCNILLLLLLLCFTKTGTAQTVKLYDHVGYLRGTYTTVAAALAASNEGDSILLSAHTFHEHNLNCLRKVVLQGALTATDTSTIDADMSGACIAGFYGVIRDVVLRNASGPCVGQMEGSLLGHTTLRHNSGLSILQLISGSLEDDVHIVNNTILDSSPDLGGAAILLNYAKAGQVQIKDRVLIANNKGGRKAGAIVLNNAFIAQKGGTAAIKAHAALIISGQVRIENNEGRRAGAIYFHAGASYLEINGCTFANNYATDADGAAVICIDSVTGIGVATPLDSVPVCQVRLSNIRIYNPLPSGKRQTEIRVRGTHFWGHYKPSYFSSEACWWGSNDTSGLIAAEPGTYFSMPNRAVTDWSAAPVGSVYTKVRTQMKLNTGAALPKNSLQTIEGIFSATAGSFVQAKVKIDGGNLVSSDYYFPMSGSYAVTASVDADTFKPSAKQLQIEELLLPQVHVYPNPAADVVYAEGLPESTTIYLYDLTGKFISKTPANPSAPTAIPLSELPSGVYVLKFAQTGEATANARSVRVRKT